uniref:PiggyBac transposable element-derived protein domain-containing protein n=1 Tax=Mola mola TaxID=94237 RepID=A0A3Q3W7P9_MOLML
MLAWHRVKPFHRQRVSILCDADSQRRKDADKDKGPYSHRFLPARTPTHTFNIKASWSPVSLFQLFFSLVPLHQRADYWRKQRPYNFHFPSNKIKRDGFVTILHSLKNTTENDRLFKSSHCTQSYIKLYMKNKPKNWGYKLFVLADSSAGYYLFFFVYKGKSVSTTYLMGGYTLYMDTFYTNPALFEEMPDNDLSRNAERGDMRWYRKSKLLFVKWTDTSGQTLKRQVKEAGVWQIKDIPFPDAVTDFNHNVGSLDLSDALIGHYNLFKLKNKPTQTKLYIHKTFREKQAADMLEFAEGSASITPTQPPATACLTRRFCKRCHDAGIPRVETTVYCRKCQIPLCLSIKKKTKL